MSKNKPPPIGEVRKIDIYDRNLSSLTAIIRVYCNRLGFGSQTSGGPIQYGVKYEELDSSFTDLTLGPALLERPLAERLTSRSQ